MAGLAVPIPSVMSLADFMSADVAVVANVYTRIGLYTVAKGEQVAFGSGIYDAMNQATGRFYAQFNTSTPTEILGRLRIYVVDYNDNLIFNVGEFDMAELNQGSTDRTKRYPWPLQKMAAKYGRKIVMDFLSGSSVTIAKAKSMLEMSATRRYVSND